METWEMIKIIMKDKNKEFVCTTPDSYFNDKKIVALKDSIMVSTNYKNDNKTHCVQHYLGFLFLKNTLRLKWEEIKTPCSFTEALEHMIKHFEENIATFDNCEYIISFNDTCEAGILTYLNSDIENYSSITTDMIYGKWYIKQ